MVYKIITGMDKVNTDIIHQPLEYKEKGAPTKIPAKINRWQKQEEVLFYITHSYLVELVATGSCRSRLYNKVQKEIRQINGG